MSLVPLERALSLPLVALAIVGCSKGDAATKRLTATFDTTASGIVRATSNQPVGWIEPSRAWKVTEAFRIQGEDGAKGDLVEPGSIGVDALGRIYVVDRKPSIIKVFDSTGTLIRTIGGEGSGPGEFRVAFMAVRGSHVVVHDPQQSRTTVFDTSGAFQKSWVSSCCLWSDIQIDTTDRIYIPTWIRPDSNGVSRGLAYTRYRFDGTVIDTIYVPSREKETKEWVFASKGKDGKIQNIMSTSVPFTAQQVIGLDPGGGVVLGWSGSPTIIRSRSGEDTTAIMTRAWTPDPIPEPLRQSQVEEMVKNAKGMVTEPTARSIARLSDIPTSAPAFTNLHVDLAGNVWASELIGSDSTKTRFQIFGRDGSWLGELLVGAAIPAWGSRLFTGDAIYAAIEGDDGRPAIVKLEVTR